jgi:hypothetical protein
MGMDVNEHDRPSYITFRHIKVKEQLVVRKDKGVNAHNRSFNITHKHT